MQNAAQVRQDVRSDQRPAIHHLSDIFKPLRDLDVVDDGVDLRKCTFDIFYGHADFEWHVPFRIKRIRCGHAPTHPKQDTGVGCRSRMIDRLAIRPQQ